MDRFEGLRAAIDAVAALPLGDQPAVVTGGEIVELVALAAALDAQICRRVAAFDAAGAAASEGSPSTAAWLRGHALLSPREARERVVVSRALDRQLPATAAALADGAVSYTSAAVIARGVEDLPRKLVPEAETALVSAARMADPARLHAEVTRLRMALAPEMAASNAETRYARRRAHASATFEGMVAVDALLDPEGGAVVLTALDAYGAPAGADDVRTAPQRRADALVEICRQTLNRGGAAVAGGERPHLTVVVDLPALLGQPGAAPAAVGWTGPASATSLLRQACDASLVRVLMAGPSEVLDVGRRFRVVSAGQRRALVVRDRGCVFPRCDRPPPWCEAHHLVPWARGGPTDLANLALLCSFHHHAVHEGGWRLTREASGRWRARGPDPVALAA